MSETDPRSFWRLLAKLTASFGVESVLVLWLSLSVGRTSQAGAIAASLAVLVPFVFAAFAWRKSAQAGSATRSRSDSSEKQGA